jgi:hypothetical protein
MQPKTQRVKPDMVVKLSNTGWWNGKPQDYDWIVSAQGMSFQFYMKKPSFGLMIGRVKKIGWYVKGVYNGPNKTTGSIDDGNYYGLPWTTGKDKYTFAAATAGMLIRLGCPIHLYVGAGYGDSKGAWQVSNGEYWSRERFSGRGMVTDFGLMIRINKLAINGGMMGFFDYQIDGPSTSGSGGGFNIGIGLTF